MNEESLPGTLNERISLGGVGLLPVLQTTASFGEFE